MKYSEDNFPQESNIEFSCRSSYDNQEAEWNVNLQAYKVLLVVSVYPVIISHG